MGTRRRDPTRMGDLATTLVSDGDPLASRRGGSPSRPGPGDPMSESTERAEISAGDQDRTLSDLLADPRRPFESLDADPRTSLGTILGALAHPGRRYVLTYLLLADGSVSTAELVDYVNRATDIEDRAGDLRAEIAAELVDVQLPRLEDDGFIDYNRERQLVDDTPRARVALPFLHLGRQYAQWQSSRTEE